MLFIVHFGGWRHGWCGVMVSVLGKPGSLEHNNISDLWSLEGPELLA